MQAAGRADAQASNETNCRQSLSSVETPTSREPSPSSRPTRTRRRPSHGTSLATTPTLSAACTSTPLATTPTAAPRPALTVSSPEESTRRSRQDKKLTHAVNPHNKTHGAPGDEERHVGDLGNIKTDGQGNSKGSVQDKLIKLIGSESVIGVRLLPSRFDPSKLTHPPAHRRLPRRHRRPRPGRPRGVQEDWQRWSPPCLRCHWHLQLERFPLGLLQQPEERRRFDSQGRSVCR
jgi:hypothetical protein